jgi:hypothetical protein
MDQNAALACKNPAMIRDLLDLAYQQKDKFSPRAARVVCFVAKIDPQLVSPYVDEIILSLKDITNTSIKSNFTNLLYSIDLAKHPDNLGLLVDLCFQWLNSPSDTPATKVYCMEILLKVVQFIPELKPELISTIEDQMTKGSAGIKTRGIEILSKL